MRLRTVLWVLVSVLVAAAPVYAQESRCSTLGDNCICSEPLSGSTLEVGTHGDEARYRSSTGTVKRCTLMPQYISSGYGTGWFAAGGSVAMATIRLASRVSHPAIFSALPSGASINYCIKQRDQHVGIQYLGAYLTNATTYVRRNIRWYEYASADWEGSGNGTCENAKFTLLSTAYMERSRISLHAGMKREYTMYETETPWYFKGRTLDNVTAFGGKQGVYTGAVPVLGGWIRYEFVINNGGGINPATGEGFHVRLYRTPLSTGVTTKVWDIWTDRFGGTGDPDWYRFSTYPGGPYKDLEPYRDLTARVDGYFISGFRQINTVPPEYPVEVCNGYRAWSHYMVAAWTTESDTLMIGPAAEIETGGVPPTASTGTFTSFTVSSILIFLVVSVAAASMICMILGIAAVRRRYVERHANDWPDPPAQPLGAMPLDGPPTSRGHDVQPVVSDARADELVGVGRAMEGAGAARERVG